MNNVEKYRLLCKEENIPLFSQAWWLDIVCGSGNWGVCLVENPEEINASMPYFVRKIFGLTEITLPPLTQNMGPWIRSSESKYAKKLGREKDLMGELIAQLPKYDKFVQGWHPSMQNWLPFYWAGFSQTTRYTYVLDDLSNMDKVWAGFQANIRTDIRKASNKHGLTVRDDVPIQRFLDLNRATFARQGMELPYSSKFAMNVGNEALKRHQGKIFVAEDDEGQLHAGVFIVWDNQSAYYLMSGGDPKLRNSGATSFLMWHAIQFASTVTKKFDFEGSMIEPVERFCRAFGAIQTPYFIVTKSPNKFFPWVSSLKSIVG